MTEPVVTVAVTAEGEIRGIPGPAFGPEHFELLGAMMAAANEENDWQH